MKKIVIYTKLNIFPIQNQKRGDILNSKISKKAIH